MILFLQIRMTKPKGRLFLIVKGARVSQVRWHTAVIPAIQEAEAGGLEV
jgi:hypothetical protein